MVGDVMKKMKLKITMITQNQKIEYITIGNYDSDKKELSYQEKQEMVTDVKLNLEKHKLIRDNKDFTMEYQFEVNNKTINTIYLKELGKTIDIQIKTEKYYYDNNNIEIEYILIDSNDKIYYEVEYEV